MKHFVAAWVTFLLIGLPAHAAEDVVFADFEGDDFAEWKKEGDAFGPSPSKGPWPGQWRTLAFQGEGLANSMFAGDEATGRLISPDFEIRHPTIAFLIGGGAHEAKNRVELWVNGKVARCSAGNNAKPIGRDELEPDHWDVSELLGRTARIEIVDEAVKGPWGHVLVDQIVFEAKRRPPFIKHVARTMIADGPFLHFPIKNDAPKRRLSISSDGVEMHYLQLQLADQDPDWWATLDIGILQGKHITLRVDKLPSRSKALAQIKLSAERLPAKRSYDERLRPKIHFSAAQGWINDPNGLLYYGGTYHVFFQHNPYGVISENKHWGHAVSSDLIHWKEEDVAISPDANWWIWSGSGVVDWKNTSQLATDDVPPILLFYTAGGPTTPQEVAFSTDEGKSFSKWVGNPVVQQITNGNRDPKVIWHEPTHRWIMALYVGLEEEGPDRPGQTIHFLSSQDLKSWKVESFIEGFWECPDLFELSVDDNPSNKKWVVTGAGGEYVIGDFDGKSFTPETKKLVTFHGNSYYAGQSFSDIPAADGRTIRMHWLRLSSPGVNFKHALSVPLEVKIRQTQEGLRMTSYPVEELAGIRRDASLIESNRELQAGEQIQSKSLTGPLDLELVIEPLAAGKLTLSIYGTDVLYDGTSQEIICEGVKAPAHLENGRLHLRVLADVTCLEIFSQEGLTVLPVALPSAADSGKVILKSTEGSFRVTDLSVFPLKPIWIAP